MVFLNRFHLGIPLLVIVLIMSIVSCQNSMLVKVGVGALGLLYTILGLRNKTHIFFAEFTNSGRYTLVFLYIDVSGHIH
jgi:hypothetical protein